MTHTIAGRTDILRPACRRHAPRCAKRVRLHVFTHVVAADTKQTKTIGDHYVCSLLARFDWAPALTRGGLAGTDIGPASREDYLIGGPNAHQRSVLRDASRPSPESSPITMRCSDNC